MFVQNQIEPSQKAKATFRERCLRIRATLLPDEIRAIRKALGMSQQAFGVMLGYGASYAGRSIHLLEVGKRRPSLPIEKAIVLARQGLGRVSAVDVVSSWSNYKKSMDNFGEKRVPPFSPRQKTKICNRCKWLMDHDNTPIPERIE